MLTQNDLATVLQKAGMVLSGQTVGHVAKEKSGCDVPGWGSAMCWLQKIKALNFQLSIEDFVSDTTIGLYNQLLSFVGGSFAAGVPVDPNVQLPGGSVIVIEAPEVAVPPAGRWVRFSDTNWNGDHTAYIEPDWAGFSPQIQLNGQRFLDPSSEFTVRPTGGFTLPSAALDGDIYVVIF